MAQLSRIQQLQNAGILKPSPVQAVMDLIDSLTECEFQTLLTGDHRLLDVGVRIASVVARSRGQAKQQIAGVRIQIHNSHQVLLKIRVEPEYSLRHGCGAES